jgi:predicted NACHT family NTPase
MAYQVLIANAEGEEKQAEKLAGPIRDLGYEVWHQGKTLVGESIIEEATKALLAGGPIVVCAIITAMGTGLVHRLVNAAGLNSPRPRVFVVQMEKAVYLQPLLLHGSVANYSEDPVEAIQDLGVSLNKYYPNDAESNREPLMLDVEQKYRDPLLKTCDIVSLANLPEQDRHLATQSLELRRLYVPLRVWVDVRKGDSSKETEWDDIERRRAVLMGNPRDSGTPLRERQRASVGARLAESRRLVVLGDPGAGKTTLTRWIATAYLLRLEGDANWQDLPDVESLPDADLLPIIVRCRDLDAACLTGSLRDILMNTLRKLEIESAEAEALFKMLRERLREGSALLVLDGLDEISDPSNRAAFCRQLERIHLAYPVAPIIATARIVGYREMGFRLGRGF